ncbi:PAS domain-containing protein [Aestuariispira insulae]|uniref:PAS domain-containing protein n=1 Tax=Aestuariispira insulae TaxID=1461337 RepID=A0A3D9HWP6_9PROT|nr:PAS domain-containing protein [Aestuariispira insulae]RED53907.1 PAS domain-containing protein [Aestuariispira insulae]
MIIRSAHEIPGKDRFARISATASWFSNFVSKAGKLPSRRDLDPTEFPDILGHQMISELHRDREDGRIRMLGTVAEQFTGLGGNASGRWFSEILDSESTRAAVGVHIQALDSKKAVFGISNYLRQDGQRVSYARLLCPLATLEGEPETVFSVFELAKGDPAMKAVMHKAGRRSP